MRKITASLQLILLFAILIISSTALYRLYSEKSASDCEDEQFIEEMYIQDNIVASALCDNSPVDIEELKSTSSQIVCYYSSQSCAACVNYAKQAVRNVFSNVGEEYAVLYLASEFSQDEKFKEKNTINLGRKKLGLPLDNTNLVYFFVIADNKIVHLFMPDKNYPEYAESYLKKIKERYCNKE